MNTSTVKQKCKVLEEKSVYTHIILIILHINLNNSLFPNYLNA